MVIRWCDACQYRCQNLPALFAHWSTCKPHKRQAEEWWKARQSASEKKEKTYRCVHCRRQYHEIGAFMGHMKTCKERFEEHTSKESSREQPESEHRTSNGMVEHSGQDKSRTSTEVPEPKRTNNHGPEQMHTGPHATRNQDASHGRELLDHVSCRHCELNFDTTRSYFEHQQTCKPYLDYQASMAGSAHSRKPMASIVRDDRVRQEITHDATRLSKETPALDRAIERKANDSRNVDADQKPELSNSFVCRHCELGFKTLHDIRQHEETCEPYQEYQERKAKKRLSRKPFRSASVKRDENMRREVVASNGGDSGRTATWKAASDHGAKRKAIQVQDDAWYCPCRRTFDSLESYLRHHATCGHYLEYLARATESGSESTCSDGIAPAGESGNDDRNGTRPSTGREVRPPMQNGVLAAKSLSTAGAELGRRRQSMNSGEHAGLQRERPLQMDAKGNRKREATPDDERSERWSHCAYCRRVLVGHDGHEEHAATCKPYLAYLAIAIGRGLSGEVATGAQNETLTSGGNASSKHTAKRSLEDAIRIVEEPDTKRMRKSKDDLINHANSLSATEFQERYIPENRLAYKSPLTEGLALARQRHELSRDDTLRSFAPVATDWTLKGRNLKREVWKELVDILAAFKGDSKDWPALQRKVSRLLHDTEDHALQYQPSRWPGPRATFEITFGSASGLEQKLIESCFKLVKQTSRHDYEASSFGWSAKRKNREMREPEMRYLVVRETRVSSLSRVKGFLSFMLTHDSDPAVPVLYIYEIHLDDTVQGLGLGAHLMQTAEDIAKRVGVEKVMMTCFLSNKNALKFYKKRGYTKDVCSPDDRITRNKVVKVDYVIMSKTVRARS